MDGSLMGSVQMAAAGRLVPRQAVPGLVLPLLGGGVFDLSAERPERFTLVVFYVRRGGA